MRSLKKQPVINSTIFRKIKNLIYNDFEKENRQYLDVINIEKFSENLFSENFEKFKQQQIFDKHSLKEKGLIIFKENFSKKKKKEENFSIKNPNFKKKNLIKSYFKLPFFQKKKKEDFEFFSKLKIPTFKIFSKNFKIYNFFFEKKISLYTGKRLINIQVFSKEMLLKNPGQFSFNKKITSNIHTLKKKKKK